jgi:hypothetical protein
MAASTSRKRTILALVLAGSLVGAAAALPALAATSTKFYTPSFTSPIPTSSAPGATVSYTFKILNNTTSTQPFGSANIVAPSGFLIGSVGTPQTSSGKTWTSAKSGSIIMLRNPGPGPSNRLNPGEYVTVQFYATAPCLAGSSYSWDTRVKQSNDFSGSGNDFTQVGDDPVSSVVVGGPGDHNPASIAFTVQPSDTLVNDLIAPAVQVTVSDACTNPEPDIAVAMSLGTNPGGLGHLLGASPPQTTNGSGVATFSNLSIDHSSSGYTLVASAGSLTATSDPFDITSDTTNCTGGSCSVSATSDNGESSVTVVSNGTGTLSVTFESVPLDCSSTGGTFQVGVTFTIDPPSTATAVTATFDDTILPPFADQYPVCKTVEQGGVTTTHIVPFCSDNGDIPACVDSQEIQFHGSAPTTLHTVVRMTPTDPKTYH